MYANSERFKNNLFKLYIEWDISYKNLCQFCNKRIAPLHAHFLSFSIDFSRIISISYMKSLIYNTLG